MHIIAISLDERSILKLHPDIERERETAIADLLTENSFKLAGHTGPYRLRLGLVEDRLAIEVADTEGRSIDRIALGLRRFKRPVRDYFAICESHFRAVRADRPAGVQAIDMARRGLHNEGAELLRDSLPGKVEMDFETARRLFTLICVLHLRQPALDSSPPGFASRH